MFVWGINDDFLISAACTAACLIPLIILKTKKKQDAHGLASVAAR
jgi:hypothetical protein